MRPAEAVSKREPKVSLEEKNAICPASIRYGQDGSAFDYTRRNINQTSVVYYCKHERKCKCKAKLLLDRDIDSGTVDRPTYNDVTIPKIPRAYHKWVKDNSW